MDSPVPRFDIPSSMLYTTLSLRGGLSLSLKRLVDHAYRRTHPHEAERLPPASRKGRVFHEVHDSKRGRKSKQEQSRRGSLRDEIEVRVSKTGDVFSSYLN